MANTLSPGGAHSLSESSASLLSSSTARRTLLRRHSILDGRYRVLAQVGKGKHGTVYRAEECQSGQPVAIKCLEPGQGHREAALLGALQHPLLPALRDVLTEDLHAYLVMEWIEGNPLWDWSAEARGPRKHLPLVEVLDIGLQLCEVFTYLHAPDAPLWFQDLHEGNVLLTAGAAIKVIDFGLARRLAPGEEAKRCFDISDIRHLLFRLLPPALPYDLKWRIRGQHPSLQPEEAQDLRAVLQALMQELGLARS